MFGGLHEIGLLANKSFNERKIKMNNKVFDRNEIHKKIFDKTKLEGKQVDALLTIFEELDLIKFKPKQKSIIEILQHVHVMLKTPLQENIVTGFLTEDAAIKVLQELHINNIRPMLVNINDEKMKEARTVANSNTITRINF